jgi:hypothetical protein
MNDEVGKLAAPGGTFRFGRLSMDKRFPLVEMRQPGWMVGARNFHPFKDEDEVRTFLAGLGFTEHPRVESGEKRTLWTLEEEP